MNPLDHHSRTLWLVRHGESTWNALGLIQGQAVGPVLTERGRAQALEVAQRLQGGAVAAIYASDLERARETAAFIGTALDLPVHTHLALRERCFGVLEGQPFGALDQAHSGIGEQRVVDTGVRPKGGESLDELYERVGTFMEWLGDRSGGGDVVVVTHGGTIRALRAYCAEEPMHGREWDEVPNGSVWTVQQTAIVHSTKC